MTSTPVRTRILPRGAPLREHLHPGAAWNALWRHRHLVVQLGRRQVRARYHGSFFGVLWNVANPLLLLGVYVLVFTRLLPVGIEPGEGPRFALRMFCGLVLFTLFSETVARAPTAVVGNPNYVKKVVFPLEMLPVADLLASAVTCAANLAVLLAAILVVQGGLPASALLFPLALPPLLGVTLGAAWLLAALGVYVRDLAASIGVIVTMLFFLTPVFYRLDGVQDEGLRAALGLNPLAAPIEAARATLLLGEPPDWGALAFAYAVAALFAWIGFVWFRATKRGFADVL